MSTDKWFYANEKREQVQVSQEELISHYRDGRLEDATLVWTKSMPAWKPFGKVPALAKIINPESSIDPADVEWHYLDANAEQQGPVSAEILKQMLIAGQIDATTYVWNEGMEEWSPFIEVEVLQDTVAKAVEAAKTVSSGDDGTAGPEEGDKVWFYVDKYRQQQGPISKQQLVERYHKFELTGMTMAWRATMGKQWKKLGEIAELKGSLGLVVPTEEESLAAAEKKRKRANKKKGWVQPKEHANIYAEGLPTDVTMDELSDFFKKAGIIKEDPFTAEVKIKCYKDAKGNLKGDASVSYLKAASVDLAMQILDGAMIRPGYPVKVTKAQYQMKGESFVSKKKPKLDKEETKAMQLAKLRMQEQSLSWDEDKINERSKDGLRIVVLKHMFTLGEVAQSASTEQFYEELKMEVGLEIKQKCGEIEKITVFEGNAEGVVAIKFKLPSSAKACIELMHDRFFAQRQIVCEFFDGTDYRVGVEAAEGQIDDLEKRVEEFGKFLESES
eukprot:gb/GEZN01005700.1/.p1 GENE.gb/GEZN01005700.1/~~gb/GEZN01005700.1/.p1  ORF type:complete len:501 (-),score=110.82 gb/GEZN01005700.1/:176-1678(-)